MKSGFFDLYARCPVALQNLLMTAYGLKLYRDRYGKAFREELALLESRDVSNLNSERKKQDAGVAEIVGYAASHSPFYQELYRGIDLSAIKNAADLAKLPVVEKETFRNNIERIYTIPRKDAGIAFTGGTTGKSLQIRYRKDDRQRRLAYLINFEKIHGALPGMRRATFNGRQFIDPEQKSRIYWRHNYVRRQKLYSTFDMTECNLPYYIEDLNRFKPQVMNGFVSALYMLADFALRSGSKFNFRPVVIMTTSETLLPFHREKIEKAFGCPVRDQYASSEGAPFISECRHGNLHFDIGTGVIESLETGLGKEMVVTSFLTHGTPLIRYRIGDMWEPMDGQCPCGSCHPMVRSLEGRSVDFLRSPERGNISLSHLADVIKGMPNCVSNMQFIQEKKDVLRVLLVIDDRLYLKEHNDMILGELRYRFGSGMDISIEVVDSIPLGPGGKYRLVVNKITG
jgi:phenylacetate-CoA ligase